MNSGTQHLRTPEALGSPVVMRPFPALRLDAQRVGDPQAARTFARPYREVAARLKSWERAGYVHADQTPAIYLHEYTVNGLTARGLVGLLELTRRLAPQAPAGVFPHEDVHPEQVLDLADRMDEMGMNPAPIVLVHSGTQALRDMINQVAATEPLSTFLCRQGTRNRLWAISDPEFVRSVQGELATSQLMIADGHHRYGAYLELQRRHRDRGHDHGLAMVIDQHDTPLFLGAIHRVLPMTSGDLFLTQARRMGAAISHWETQDEALAHLAPGTVIMSAPAGWSSLSMSAATAVEGVDAILEALGETRVEYHHSVDSALSAAPGGVALLMPSPDYARITELASHGHVLPQKATSFQPKPPVGVLMRTITP